MFTPLDPSQWIALALALIGGVLLGLALHPGGRKWRARYLTERDAHAASRRDAEARAAAGDMRLRELEADRGRADRAEARLAELERVRDTGAGELTRSRESLSLAQARIRELERENERLNLTVKGAPPPATARPVEAAPAREPAPEAMPVRRVVTGAKRGWFDWGPGSDPRAHPRG